MHEIEFHIAINAEGEFRISTDTPDEAINDLNGDADSEAVRTYSIKLNVPLPKVATVTGTLPDTDGPVTLTIG